MAQPEVVSCLRRLKLTTDPRPVSATESAAAFEEALRFQRTPHRRARSSLSSGSAELHLSRVVGVGAFGVVVLALPEPRSPSRASSASSGTSTVSSASSSDNLHQLAGTAVKVLPKCCITSAEAARQVVAEADALRRLHSHPFIVGFRFAYQTSRAVYLGTEFCAGGDLFELLRARDAQPLRVDEVRLYAAEIALALQHMHEHGVLYRDLKPENICLAADGHVRIVDFGMAVLLTDAHMNHETGRREVVTDGGTLAYASPEMLRRVPHGPEADWWSLGVLLHELLFGDLPWFHTDPSELCARICTDPVPEPTDARLASDGDLRSGLALVQLLLTKEPADRPGFLCDGVDALRAAPFFSAMDWDDLPLGRSDAPRRSRVNGAVDLSRFDPTVTSRRVSATLREQLRRSSGALMDKESAAQVDACLAELPRRTHALDRVQVA